MNIAKKYFQKHLANNEFTRAYLEERVKLDIEYQLEELKKAIQTNKDAKELIKKVNSIEQFVMSV